MYKSFILKYNKYQNVTFIIFVLNLIEIVAWLFRGAIIGN